MATRTLVTAGPTISAAEIRALLPDAEVVPPISFGDAFTYQLGEGDRLLIIDGLFLQSPAVRHKELLRLLDDGVTVAGASSMGALRAAELYRYGMHGFGKIFEAYRNGSIEADDEVAMVHGGAQDGYPVFVDALVNIRATLQTAVTAEVVSGTLASNALAVARQLPFTARSWHNLLRPTDLPEDRITELIRQLRSLRTDQKRLDAVAALQSLATGVEPRTPQWQRPAATIWTKRWAERWTPGTLVYVDASSAPVRVRDIDVVTLLRLAAEPGWMYEPALEQVAAWSSELDHSEAGSVTVSADRAIDLLDEQWQPGRPDTRLRKLERIAHAHLQNRGLCDDDGLPPRILANWLTPSELAAAAQDPALGSALVASRTLLHDPSLPELSHLLDLIRQDTRFPTWQRLTAQMLKHGSDLAEQKPALNLQKPLPGRLDELFRRRWQTDDLRLAKAIRGFVTDESFYLAAVPFAPAAATGMLPTLHVGRVTSPLSRSIP